MSDTRLHLRHRRRSHHNRRPPPGPVTIVLCQTQHFRVDKKRVHTPSHARLVATTERLAANLFCNFARWATIVHRATQPTTVVQAAHCLGHLRWPATSICLTCDTTQMHAFAFGKHLRLNTAMLLPGELRDLRWLAHASSAWKTWSKHSGSTPATQTVRRNFVLNDVFRRAHKAMLVCDNNTWGGLVPPQLIPMVLHTCEQLHFECNTAVPPTSSSSSSS